MNPIQAPDTKILWLDWLIATLILSTIAFYNGFPLVTPDTGSYIYHFIDHSLPRDRPPFYGWFIKFTSLKLTLWTTVFAQSGIISWLLIRLLQIINKQLLQPPCFISLVIAIAFLTNVSWIASYLMPDVFTGILLISIILFFLTPKNKTIDFILYSILITFCVLMHNSHLVIVGGCAILFMLISLRSAYRIHLKKSALLLTISIFSWLVICWTNYHNGYGFIFSRSTHVFLMGKLGEAGILNKYLDDKCPTIHYRICDYRDDIPSAAWEFVWNSDSPLQKAGGWDSTKVEYTNIIHGIFSHPKYLGMFAWKSLIASGRELTQNDLFVEPQGYNTSPWQMINKHYQHELKEYFYSRQNQRLLQFDDANRYHFLFFIVSSVWILILFRHTSLPANFRIIYFVTLVFLLVNAFVVASFANVLYRLQNRVFWVLPVMNAITLANYYVNKYSGKDYPSE